MCKFPSRSFDYVEVSNYALSERKIRIALGISKKSYKGRCTFLDLQLGLDDGFRNHVHYSRSFLTRRTLHLP